VTAVLHATVPCCLAFRAQAKTSVSQPHVLQAIFEAKPTPDDVVHIVIQDHLDLTTVTNDLFPGSQAKFDFSILSSTYRTISSIVVCFWAGASGLQFHHSNIVLDVRGGLIHSPHNGGDGLQLNALTTWRMHPPGQTEPMCDGSTRLFMLHEHGLMWHASAEDDDYSFVRLAYTRIATILYAYTFIRV
jgi:hypothetical protein